MRRGGSIMSQRRQSGLETLPLNAIYFLQVLFGFTQDVTVPVFGQIQREPRLFKELLMNALLLPSCIMFHVKAGITHNPSFLASPTQTRTYTHVYPAKHGPALSRCLFMLSQSTWVAAWPVNHNICRLVFTTVLTLRPPQSLPVELTDFSCSKDTSAPERTNQSYFTSSTR